MMKTWTLVAVLNGSVTFAPQPYFDFAECLQASVAMSPAYGHAECIEGPSLPESAPLLDEDDYKAGLAQRLLRDSPAIKEWVDSHPIEEKPSIKLLAGLPIAVQILAVGLACLTSWLALIWGVRRLFKTRLGRSLGS
jgi:hypothetical protein